MLSYFCQEFLYVIKLYYSSFFSCILVYTVVYFVKLRRLFPNVMSINLN